jgi:hypothetical protein
LDYLDTAYENQLQGEGVSPAFHSFVGELNAGGSGRTSLVLPGNEALVLFGVCDNECSDLDMVLRTSSGEIIDDDTQDDDIPLVIVDTEGSPLEVSLEVRMITCTVEPCYYAVGVFRRN